MKNNVLITGVNGQDGSYLTELLIKRGYEIVSGGTDNHIVLLNLNNKNITGASAELRLKMLA